MHINCYVESAENFGLHTLTCVFGAHLVSSREFEKNIQAENLPIIHAKLED